MAGFLLRRVLSAAVLLLIISVITFMLIQAQDGDYASYLKSWAVSQGGMNEVAAEELAEAARVRLGLDKPLYVQYFAWLRGIVTEGDFGISFVHNKPVSELIGERMWRTLGIATTCHILATILGVLLGIYAAMNQHRLGDTLATVFAFLGMTIPRFFMALLILYWLAFVVSSKYIG
ncbi:MAG: ABC transporter permease, partial [Pseudomonadota bacterium]